MEGRVSKKNDGWYTPKRVFDALCVEFDIDVAAPIDRQFCHVPAKEFITENSLDISWNGFVWMNPPYSGSKTEWLNKMFIHNNGIALLPDRTSAPWWPIAAKQCDLLLFVTGKIKFIKPDGTVPPHPGNGSTLFAYGQKATEALKMAEFNGLGIILNTL